MRNQKFNILSAIGIILVVGGHSSIQFIPWFTPYSFHMPLFMFISGYFFHAYTFRKFLKRKVTHLLLPLLFWNVFYVFLVMLLVENNLTRITQVTPSFFTLIWSPLTSHVTGGFNGPAWFVGTLFWVQLLFWGIYRIIGAKDKNLYYIGGLAVIFLEVAVWWSTHGGNTWFYNTGLGINRVLFCFIFYWLGYVYHVYWEKYDTFSINKIVFLFIFNGIILGLISSQIVYYIAGMKFFSHKYWLPLVTACSGIWLCLQVATLLQEKIDRAELFSKLGEHTFPIMVHHLFFFWLLNTIFYYMKCVHILRLESFDYSKYMTYIYYRITAHAAFSDLLYIGVCLGGPMVMCWLYSKLIKKGTGRLLESIKSYK